MIGLFGTAARFFTCAKASKKDRDEGLEDMPDRLKLTQMRSANGTGDKNFEGIYRYYSENHHPTVKTDRTHALPLPPSLHLQVVTIPDPLLVLVRPVRRRRWRFSFVGVEREKEYCEIAKKRN